jgi:MoaA/NifB/PqqE/SkfB family radical SAM enzyme
MKWDEVDFRLFQPSFQTFIVLLTNRCNLTCKHCYVSSSPKGIFGLPTERVCSLIDEIHELYGEKDFVLTGGEPLVRRADCLAILRAAAARHRTRLLTNGTLIIPEVAERLTELRINIRISVDGADARSHDHIRGRGSFDKTLAGIQNLHRAGFPADQLELYATIVPESVSTIGSILKLADELGSRTVVFAAIAKLGRAVTFWPNIPREAPDIDTAAYRDYFRAKFDDEHGARWSLLDLEPYERGFTSLNFYSDGRVYPYTYMDEADERSGYLGNLMVSPLQEILAEETIAKAILLRFVSHSRGPARSLRTLVLRRRPETAPLGGESIALSVG